MIKKSIKLTKYDEQIIILPPRYNFYSYFYDLFIFFSLADIMIVSPDRFKFVFIGIFKSR